MVRARQALQELLVSGWHRADEDDPTKPRESVVSSIRLFDTLEIYPGARFFSRMLAETDRLYA